MNDETTNDSTSAACGASGLSAELGISLKLLWRPVPETLPPDPDGGWFSPTVWLALSDGRVIPGQCLHKSEDAKYDAPVHSWFIEKDGKNVQLADEEVVIGWMPFAVPDHPRTKNGGMLIPNYGGKPQPAAEGKP